MKLQILCEDLQKKLSFVIHGVSSKNQLPILLNILLLAKDGKLKIQSTDLEIGIEVLLSANIEEEGGVTVPAKVFYELINSLPNGKITLEVKNNILEVTSIKSRSSFPTTNTEEFPKLYEEKGKEVLVIKKTTIHEDFGSVVFASGLDMARPALTGVLLAKQGETEESKILFVATDGYRLSLKKHTSDIVQRQTFPEKKIIIPSRVIREVIGMKEEGGDMSLFILEKSNQVVFSQNDTSIIGRLIDADFPNYERIIPTDFGTKVVFDKEDMQKAVKTCAIFARDTANVIKISFLKNKIIVSANTPSVGENTVELDGKLTGEENEIAFNSRYLLDLFSNIDVEQMCFEMSGPLSPGVFTVPGNSSFLHLIMPIKIQTD